MTDNGALLAIFLAQINVSESRASDGTHLFARPYLTQYLASKAIQCELRKSVKQWIEKKINESTYNETIKNIILGKFQKEMKDSIKKITSVKTSEIRIIKIEEGKKQFKFEENLDKTKVEA